MPDLVENPEERFSDDAAHSQKVVYQCVSKIQSTGKGSFFELSSAQRCNHVGLENAIFVGKDFFYKMLQTKDGMCFKILQLETNTF